MTPAWWVSVVGFLVAAALVCLVGGRLQLDADAVDYRDGWRTEARMPDKPIHAALSWAITLLAGLLAIPPAVAAACALVAGAMWELMQYLVARDLGASRVRLSWYDLAADAAGAALGALTLVGAALVRDWLGLTL